MGSAAISAREAQIGLALKPGSGNETGLIGFIGLDLLNSMRDSIPTSATARQASVSTDDYATNGRRQ